MKNKIMAFAAFLVFVAMFGYVKAEQGDYATLGYSTPLGYSYWRVDSSGHLKPGAASTYDLGTSALPIGTIYVGTISGASVSAGGAFSGTTGAFSSTLDADGQVTLGAANSVSTVTTAGVATFSASVTAPDLSATDDLTVTDDATFSDDVYFGDANFISSFTATTGAQTWTGSITSDSSVTARTNVTATAGYVQVYSRSLAQLNAVTPTAVGQMYYCNNCVDSPVCVSSGTGAGAFVSVSSHTISHCN